MNNFAPTMPAPLYPLLDNGNYHLVQAHDLANRPSAQAWFARLGEECEEHTVVLDNGAAELGAARTDTLWEITRTIRPDVVVCPDVVRDTNLTLSHFSTYYRICLCNAQRVMVVPQGDTIERWMFCAQAMLGSSNIDRDRTIVGLTKFIPSPLVRVAAAMWLTAFYRKRHGVTPRIHLLGTSKGLRELVEVCQVFRNIYGADTTLPLAAALADRLVHLSPDDAFPMPEEAWRLNELTRQQSALAALNIATCREWLRRPGRVM